MSTILLTYGTRPIAQRIVKLLSAHHQLILATNEEVPSVLAHTYKSIPNPANPVFAHEMLKLCLDQGIDLILPLGAAEIEVLSGSSILFEEYGINIVRPFLSPQQEIIKQIPAGAPLLIVHDSKSLSEDCQIPSGVENGVYALSEEAWLPIII